MCVTDLVRPTGQDHQSPGASDASIQISQQVERRFVCPLNVFEDRQREAVLEFDQERGEQEVALCLGIEKRWQLSPDLGRHVMQRSERARRGQRVTRTPQTPDVGRLRFGKGFDQCGLSDSGLADDKREATGSASSITYGGV